MTPAETLQMYRQLDEQRAKLAVEAAKMDRKPKKGGKANLTATAKAGDRTNAEALKKVSHAASVVMGATMSSTTTPMERAAPTFELILLCWRSLARRERSGKRISRRMTQLGAAQMALEGVQGFVPVRVGSPATGAAHAAAQPMVPTSSTSATTTPTATASTSASSPSVDAALQALQANVTTLANQQRAMLWFFENFRDSAHASQVMDDLFRESSDGAPGRGHVTYSTSNFVETHSTDALMFGDIDPTDNLDLRTVSKGDAAIDFNSGAARRGVALEMTGQDFFIHDRPRVFTRDWPRVFIRRDRARWQRHRVYLS